MSDFINTVDMLGDESTLDALIERTITDFSDDQLTSLVPRSHSFHGCTEMVSVNLPNVKRVKWYDFMECTSLKRISIPSVEEYIEQGLFEKCKSLELIELHSRVTEVRLQAFKSCTSLRAVIFRYPNVPVMRNTDAFTGTPISTGTGYIYVPSAVIEDYKTATNWSTYANQFRALEDYTVDGTITGALDETKI